MGAEKQSYLIVLGISQDGGVPQAGTKEHKGWEDNAFKRHVVCLAVVDPETSTRWMIECTPDFRDQLHVLDEIAPVDAIPGLDGIFLTHAHMGHYTGLIHLGHESMGARGARVYAMPQMQAYLNANGPWNQLVANSNVTLKPLKDAVPVPLSSSLAVEPFLVPHRQQYSETVGYRVHGPNRSVLFIPDIDSWEEWDEQGTQIERVISETAVAYLDGTFYTDGELPGRNSAGFPHPSITHSMERLRLLSPGDREKVRFIHLNHTNPALVPQSAARRTIEKNGFRVAEEMERIDL